jgi:predicted nucleic acid-binding protein
MKLVVDASVLVAEALRESGRKRLGSSSLELYLAEHAYREAKHELSKRFTLFVERVKLSEETAKYLWQRVLESLELPLIVPESGYEHLETLAKECIRDVNDWPTLALALILGCGIWTQDYDFFGTGVATWSTENIDKFVKTARAEE